MNARAVLSTAVRAVVTIALLAWVLSNEEIRKGLLATKFQKPWFLVGAVLCAAGAAFVAAWRWLYCMRACDCALPFWTVLRISLAGDATGLFSVGPLGVDAVRIALSAKEHTGKKAALVTSVALDHVSAIPVMIALGIAILSTLGLSPEMNRISAITVVASVVAFFGAGLTLRAFRRELHDRILTYVKERLFSRGAASAALISVPLVALHFGIFWCTAAALPLEAPPLGLLGGIIVADTIAALPISIGGLGVREKSFELLLNNWYGIAPALSVKASLAGVAVLALWAVAGTLLIPLRRARKTKLMTKNPVNIRKLSDRFPLWNPRYYAWCKFATDPLYEAVFTALAGTNAPLLDIGCGMGLNSFYLRERGCKFPMRGLDYDASKIAAAKKAIAANDQDLFFETSDARSGLPEHSGSVTILDILQYMNADAQAALLREAAARVAPGGKLVIRTGMNAPGWRFQLTRVADYFAACCFWMKAAPVTYPRPETLTATLESCGLRGTIRPLWGRTPFNNWLAVFERPIS